VRVAPTPGVLPESGTWEGGDHDAPAGEALNRFPLKEKEFWRWREVIPMRKPLKPSQP